MLHPRQVGRFLSTNRHLCRMDAPSSAAGMNLAVRGDVSVPPATCTPRVSCLALLSLLCARRSHFSPPFVPVPLQQTPFFSLSAPSSFSLHSKVGLHSPRILCYPLGSMHSCRLYAPPPPPPPFILFGEGA